MNSRFISQLQLIFNEIVKKRTNFYYQKYSKAKIKGKSLSALNEELFNNLPTVTLAELAKTPYKNRFISEKPGFNKLVFSKKADRFLLIHRDLEEIAKAGPTVNKGIRPMVLMEDVYEAIEACLYFYEHKTLPLIGEVLNPAVVYATAAQYDINSLIIDRSCLLQFRSELLKLKIKLDNVTVVGAEFSSDDISWPKIKTVNAILSLPEFGRIAYACSELITKKKFVFHPYKDVLIEAGLNAILTSTRLKSCPMIRYKSDLSLTETNSSCSHKEQSFTLGESTN